jgi:hypothetical protein
MQNYFKIMQNNSLRVVVFFAAAYVSWVVSWLRVFW